MKRRTKEEIKNDGLLISKIKESISGIIDFKHDMAIIKGLLLINEFQTHTELVLLATSEDNGIGFNYVDGTIASSYCEQLSNKYWLSEKQLIIARRIVKKYWKQLFNISKTKYISLHVNNVLERWITRNQSNYFYCIQFQK